MPELEQKLPKRIRDKLARMAVAFDKIDALLFRLGQQGLQRMTQSSATELKALEQTAHNAALITIERQIDTLGTHVQRYLDKDPLFAMRDYVATVNRIWLLNRKARELHTAGKLPDEMIDVIGEARRSYQLSEQPIVVAPLGATGWVTDTDFVGITVYFCLQDSDAIVQASNCKPTMYFGSDPRRLMTMEISDYVRFTIHDMAHGAFELTQAKLSKDGRLSLHKDLQVKKAPYIGARAYEKLRVADWQELLERLRQGEVHPLGGGGSQLAFLSPNHFGEVVVDEKEARCTVELFDTTGAAVQIEIPLRAENNFLIDNLEQMLGAQGRKKNLVPDALFGRAWAASGMLKFFPFTAIYEEAVKDQRSRRVNEVHLALEPLGQVRR